MKEVYSNAKVTPERLVGEHKANLPYVAILQHLQMGDLADTIIDNIFQALENEKSTIELIKKFGKKIGLDIDQNLADTAIYYLEIRHKLVHTDGFVDKEFKKKHGTLKYTGGNKIKIDYDTICQAYEGVFHLISDIDSKVIRMGLAKCHTFKDEVVV